MQIDLSLDDWMNLLDSLQYRLRVLEGLQKKLLESLKPEREPEETIETTDKITQTGRHNPPGAFVKGRRGRRSNAEIAAEKALLDGQTPAGPQDVITEPAVEKYHVVRVLAKDEKPVHIGEVCGRLASLNPGLKIQVSAVEKRLRSHTDTFVEKHKNYWMLQSRDVAQVQS